MRARRGFCRRPARTMAQPYAPDDPSAALAPKLGTGPESYAEAVRLLREAAESGLRAETEQSFEDQRASTQAMARSLRCFDAALQGPRVSPPLRCLRRQVARDGSLTSSRAQIRAWMRRLGIGWATAPRTSARA